MSKDKPEVGDVWKANKSEIEFMLTNKDVRVFNFWYSIAKDGRTKRILINDCFFEENTYLGKSKVNIDDLFKTENE